MPASPFSTPPAPAASRCTPTREAYVYFNGKQAKLKKVNKEYYEATGSGITLSISLNPDESVSLT